MLTWAKEAFEPLKLFMKLLSGHHWTTHSVLVVLVFLTRGWALSRAKGIPAQQLDEHLARAIALAVVLGGIGLFGGFLFFF